MVQMHLYVEGGLKRYRRLRTIEELNSVGVLQLGGDT